MRFDQIKPMSFRQLCSRTKEFPWTILSLIHSRHLMQIKLKSEYLNLVINLRKRNNRHQVTVIPYTIPMSTFTLTLFNVYN